MKTIKGQVLSGKKGLMGVLIEAFHVDKKFQYVLPISNREELNKHVLKRLGSSMSQSNGDFEIKYSIGKSSKIWLKENAEVNLWVVASAYRKNDKDLELLYQCKNIRTSAGDEEFYLICLSEEYEYINIAINPKETKTSETITALYKDELKIENVQLKIDQEKFKKRSAVRKNYEDKIAPKIRQKLSLVELDEKGNPTDENYVRSDKSIRKKSETRIKEILLKNYSKDSERKISFSGRISLTDNQLVQIKEKSKNENLEESEEETQDSKSNNIIIGEDELYEVLESTEKESNGSNPESRSQIVNRVDAIKLYCKQKTNGQLCLDKEDDFDINEEGNQTKEEEQVFKSENDRPDKTGNNIAATVNKEDIPRYIAKILNEESVLDPTSNQLPSTGSRLTQDGITSAASFPSLTLPPGPADVPAYYDFYDLQIAFKPVWQEAIDESFVEDIGNFYDYFVENGGDLDSFLDGVLTSNCKIFKTSLFNYTAPVNSLVQKYIEITRQEWNALTQGQRVKLESIASKINEYVVGISISFDSIMLGSNNSSMSFESYKRARHFVDIQINELEKRAERLLYATRVEMEHQAISKSLIPNNKILNQLIERANSSYPAKYFAANKKQRSINFGLLVNYRQKWTPTAYQVGELVKSVPLAPKESRKYSKKIVKKTKRAEKEIENNLESLKDNTKSTIRGESDIVQKAMDKTNFNASAKGSFSIGVWSGGGSSGLSQDAESQSSENKKNFHEAVVKAAREYKNELKVELETESVFESEFQESGEIMNLNDELTVTYLFYELQRRYRVEERLHRLTSVVMVAQEMPCPADIDEDWLIAHRWILNRVMLDDSFKQPLFYIAEGQAAEQFALEELRKTLAQQRRLVEDLREDVSESRELTESRYAALQRSMERTARSTQKKKKGGGLLGFAKKLTAPGIIGDFVDKFIGGENESPEAARVREAAAQDAYQRELQKLRDNEAQLAQSNNSLRKMTEDYSNRLADYLSNMILVTELKNHVKDNITHYMQAVWMHEPFQQRWLRLKDVPVPVLKRSKRRYVINVKPVQGSLANVTHLRTKIYDYTTTAEVELPNDGDENFETVPLYQVADIDGLLGFRANYMIFPMKKSNAITDFMMEPYVEKAGGAYGLTDPDELGNLSLDDFSEYVCCLKKKLKPKEFERLRDELKAQLKKLLQSPLRNDEEIVVPMDAMYIEALPGATPILEDFKLLHRQIDAADAQEDLRLKKMEKLRYAQRLLMEENDDPETDSKYVFEGLNTANVVPNAPSDGN